MMRTWATVELEALRMVLQRPFHRRNPGPVGIPTDSGGTLLHLADKNCTSLFADLLLHGRFLSSGYSLIGIFKRPNVRRSWLPPQMVKFPTSPYTGTQHIGDSFNKRPIATISTMVWLTAISQRQYLEIKFQNEPRHCFIDCEWAVPSQNGPCQM